MPKKYFSLMIALTGALIVFFVYLTNPKVVKNKIAPPFKTCEFDIMYNEGISVSGDILDQGVIYGVITKAGNSYSYGEIKLGVGRENDKTFLRGDKKLIGQIRKEILKKAGINN